MSTLTQRMVARFDRWLDRVVADDERYVCAACDDRFRSRSLGIDHVLHCHPEYQGVVVYDGAVPARPAPVARPTASRPAWSPLPTGLKPVPVHIRSY